MKHLTYILLLFYGLTINSQIERPIINTQDGDDVSYILQDLQKNLAIGNGCGQMFGEQSGYNVCYTNGLELNGNTLQIMSIELTVYGNITENGNVKSLEYLLNNERILLECQTSNVIVLDE